MTWGTPHHLASIFVISLYCTQNGIDQHRPNRLSSAWKESFRNFFVGRTAIFGLHKFDKGNKFLQQG